jgi:uncharacterized protein (TIGR02246 family)
MSASEIAEANRRLEAAVAAGDAAAGAACYAEDGQFLVPNFEPLTGRSSIQGFFQSVLDTGIRTLELETLELEEHGDKAFEVGRYTLKADGGAVADRGKFIVIWKKVGGAWYLYRDIINTSVPTEG